MKIDFEGNQAKKENPFPSLRPLKSKAIPSEEIDVPCVTFCWRARKLWADERGAASLS